MYAIIETGGKQYRVTVGEVIDVELLESDRGAKIEFAHVLFSNDGSKMHIGQPRISDFLVYGEVLGQVSGEKVTSLKYKASHNQCRKWGHRQKYTRVKITAIGNYTHTEDSHHGA